MSGDEEDVGVRVLEDYRLHETIGSGGFGKVKLATHILTGEKVAVKIIDKKAVGDDLFRMVSELKAMKMLSHQHICRLYQAVETDAKFYFILEHCAGGELFDYIVKKEFLAEPEARHFFRQIVAALAYVHSNGYAHRDIKPENLLLTADLQIKLIDFGLCARPESGLTAGELETCCGSPAYAAPELILGKPYKGAEVDIWSMGVLLYALLCGCLPFEDENFNNLYRKIAAGQYAEPSRLSKHALDILRSMLQTEPKHRASIEDLLKHPWLIDGGYLQPLKWRSIYDAGIVDEECAHEMSRYYGCSLAKMIARIKKWEYGAVTATYFLLLARKRKKRPVILPLSNRKAQRPTMSPSSLLSPTIHASLEGGLDTLEPLDSHGAFDYGASPVFAKGLKRLSSSEDSDSEVEELEYPTGSDNRSYAKAIVAGAKIVSTNKHQRVKERDPLRPPPLPTSMPPTTTPLNQKIRRRQAEEEKENEYQRLPAQAERTPRPKSLYHNLQPSTAPCTPGGNHLMPPPASTPAQYAQKTPLSVQLKNKDLLVTPEGSGRSPRSGQRGRDGSSDKLSRRMFASVERKVDRVFNLLTPSRKTGAGQGTGPGGTRRLTRSEQGMINISTTAAADPAVVMDELFRVFAGCGISSERHGWKISGKSKEGGRRLSIELELVWIDHLQCVGIRRKRLNGDAFMYKRVCEQILTLACPATH